MKSENNIRILHFLPRWDNGGMEHAALDIVTHFDDAYTYEICAAFLESEFAFEELKEKKIKFTALYRNREYSFKDCVKGLYSYLKGRKYDIVHCHINNAIGLVFAVVSKLVGVENIVVHTHNNSFGAGKLALKKLLRTVSIGLFGNTPDLYLACSDEAGKWTFGSSVARKQNYHVVYNGIDQSKFYYNVEKRNELRKKYALSGKFIIGHIGHFNYQKNQAFLLQTIQSVSRVIPDVCYFFVGTGETKKEFLKEIHEKNLDAFVTVIDTVNNPQDFYSMFDVFAFPSHFEGFGIVMIEAQINGLPVVCSENVPRETAITSHVKYLPIDTKESVQLWNNAIIECKKEIGEVDRSASKVCAKCDIAEISKEIRGYYKSLMEKKRDESWNHYLVEK